ncbi:hypothetical protein GQ55_1G437700 [Panicum hallii var. hallii]|uniref:Ubiquitin-like protease family profile domain-containing protein n=1 Tax=Panicum hallii var. hallii TaxID=1504633 RepID=A0A2T7FDT9_9POAL|nr:hypothetical protein GQ55_1G437700 [Panicum hallii var. hallii]
MLADLTSRDRAQLYQEHVLDRTRDTVKLDILDHVVVEKYFVECFKPGGYMHSNIFFLQSLLWNREWKGKYILSEKASGELLRPQHGTKRLDQELGLHYGEEALIFIPIVHDNHWFLIAISVKDRIIHVLDSLPGESRESLICQIIKTLKEHLPQSNAGSKYKIDVVPVQKQSNTYDWFPRVALHRKL